jgi:hypothetical protein
MKKTFLENPINPFPPSSASGITLVMTGSYKYVHPFPLNNKKKIKITHLAPFNSKK